MDNIERGKRFWKWFEKNNTKYLSLDEVDDYEKKEELLDDFLKRSHKYNENIFFEMGGHRNEKQNLIITAEGNSDEFEEVESLVRQAPHMTDWQVTAFKPAAMSGFTINYRGVKLNPASLWFFSP